MANIQTIKNCDLVDSDNELAIYCATISNATPSSPTPSSRKDDIDDAVKTQLSLLAQDGMRRVRGTIIEIRTNRIVLEGSFFPYEYSATHNDLGVFTANLILFNRRFQDMTVEYAFEGTILRIYYYNNKWMISTHHKLDSGKSKWGSNVSFKDLFERGLRESYGVESLEAFLRTLNLRCTYTFMVMADENTKFVCDSDPDLKKVYLVSVDGKRPIPTSSGCTTVGGRVKVAPLPQFDQTFGSVDELFAFVETLVFPYTFQGLLLTHKDGAQYRIVSEEYARLYQVRNNQQSIPFRYIELRGESNLDSLEWLRKLFPQHSATFDLYDSYFEKIADIILEQCLNKKNGATLTLPQPYYLFIKNNLRQIQDLDRTGVINHILKQPAPVINSMMKIVKFDQKQQAKQEQENTLVLSLSPVAGMPDQSVVGAPLKKKKIKYVKAEQGFLEFTSRKKLVFD